MITMLFLVFGAAGIVDGDIVVPAVFLSIGVLLVVAQVLMYLWARRRLARDP